MISRWEETDSYSAHGWLIPPVCACLLWRDRRKIADAWLHPGQGRALGLGLCLAALGFHALMGLFDVSSLSLATLLPFGAGLALILGGRPMLKTTWFAIAFLFFMMPLPDFMISGMNFRLKLIAADLAAGFLNHTGIPAIRTGSFLIFENTRLAVGDVCSGLRSLISLIALGVLYARFMDTRAKAVSILLLVLPAALFGNGLRIVVVSWLVLGLGRDFVFTPFVADWDVHLLTGAVIFLGTFSVLWLAMRGYDALSAMRWNRVS